MALAEYIAKNGESSISERRGILICKVALLGEIVSQTKISVRRNYSFEQTRVLPFRRSIKTLWSWWSVVEDSNEANSLKRAGVQGFNAHL